MEHTLPDLPYAKTALAPHISAETLDYHHGKHHKAYVDKLNELIKGTKHQSQSLEEIIMSSEGPLFNNAAQHWNHSFFWRCLTPKGGGFPTGKVGEMISKRWGANDKFQEEFNKQAVANFGSGWTWLVQHKSGELDIMNTHDADTPMTSDLRALLTVDVWEHAYYIDYRNARPEFLDHFWKLVDWDFVNSRVDSKHAFP